MALDTLILDGYNLIHRARGGFQGGEWPVIFNFFRGLKSLIQQFKPKEAYFVTEGTPKCNIELYEDYKANRAPAPAGFLRQKDAIIDILKRMPIRLFNHPNFEADDVINALVGNSLSSCKNVIVISSDSDFIQLLQRYDTANNALKLWNWRNKSFISPPSHDYVGWKSLRGDPTDNISRCPGMTEKVAMQVINDKASFEKLMTDDAFKETFIRNEKLIRFCDFSHEEYSCIESFRCEHPDWEYVREHFTKFGFKSIVNDVGWEKFKGAFACIDVQ
jgi:DNA polymerase-1